MKYLIFCFDEIRLFSRCEGKYKIRMKNKIFFWVFWWKGVNAIGVWGVCALNHGVKPRATEYVNPKPNSGG
jgi:hypothetical protein